MKIDNIIIMNKNSNSSSINSSKENGSLVKNETLSMLIGLGMVGSAAGFALYTKRTGSMLKQMEQIAKNKQKRMPPPRVGPHTKAEWDKIRPRFDKDEFV